MMLTPFGHKDYSKNSKKCKGTQVPCAWCGKPIKDQYKAKMVLICCDLFNPAGGEDAHKSHGNNMGGYPLGPDCYKLISGHFGWKL